MLLPTAVAPRRSAISHAIRLSLITATGLALIPGASLADVTFFDAVTSVATRTEQATADTAQNVDVIGRDQIERSQATSIPDLLRKSAGVDLASGPRAISQQVFIRGMSDERILFLVDGARQNFESGHKGRVFIEPELLKQVEVLKGPASAVWGSGALGGVVAMTTQDAADLLKLGEDFGGSVKLGYQGVSEQFKQSAMVYGLAGDNLDWVAQISHRDNDDIELGDDSTLANSSSENLSAFAKLNWTPTEIDLVRITAQQFEETGGVPSNPAAALGGTNPLIDRTTTATNLTFAWTRDDPENSAFQPSANLYYNLTDIDENRITGGARFDETDLETWGTNLRAVSVFGDHQLSYGLDYHRDTAEGRRDGAPRTQFPDAKSEVAGVFLQDQIALGPLTLLPGIRFDSFEASSSANVAAAQSESEQSLMFGATYRLTDWLTINGGYFEAFRAPNINELFVTGTHFAIGALTNDFIANPNLRPEKAHNKEIGLRIQHEDLWQKGDSLSFRGSYYQNDVDDLIEQVVNVTFVPGPDNPGGAGTTTNNNVADATLTGGELELGYDAPDWFTSLSFSTVRGDNNTANTPLADSPPDKWQLGLGYKMPAHDLTIGYELSLVASQDRVPAGTSPTNSYSRQDISLTWAPSSGDLKGLRLNAGIDNVTDQAYRHHNAVLLEPGRNYKLAVSWNF